MKIKKIIIIIILVAIIGIGGFTLYKYKNKENINNPTNQGNQSNNKNGIKYTTYEANSGRKDLKWSETRDNITYKDYIVTKNITAIDYDYYDEEKSIAGKIYIDNGGLLHITENNSYEDNIISDIKFKTMRARKCVEDTDDIDVFLISEDNKLYEMILYSNDINDYDLNELYTRWPVLNFTNLGYDVDMEPSCNTLFVLENDNNIFEVFSKYRYIPNVKLMFDSLMVFEDGVIASPYGSVFKDKNDKYYKAKYVFDTKASDELNGYDTIVIITEDNELIAFYDITKFDVANVKVKNVKFDKKYPFVAGKLELELDNNKKITLDAKCSTYYCVNEFNY